MATAPKGVTPTVQGTYAPQPAYQETSGWVIFAGVVLMVAGIMRIFDSIWAFSYHGAIPQDLQNALFGRSLSTYGWLWLVVGIILFLSGGGAMLGSQVGRWIGVFGAVIGTITAIWWMPYYPIWSLMYIALGVLVVYALIAHGQREVAA